MASYHFERESRTPYSESYIIAAGTGAGQPVGRVDLHFAPGGIVHATLCVPADFAEDAVEDLVGEVDERLVLPADPYRDDLVVTVWAGRHAGVYSEDDDFEDDEDLIDVLEEDDEEDPGEDGREPVA